MTNLTANMTVWHEALCSVNWITSSLSSPELDGMVENCLGTCTVACKPLGSCLPGQQIPWGLPLLLQKSALDWLKISILFLPMERKISILRGVKSLESLEHSCDVLFFWDFTVSRDMISPQRILNLPNKKHLIGLYYIFPLSWARQNELFYYLNLQRNVRGSNSVSASL